MSARGKSSTPVTVPAARSVSYSRMNYSRGLNETLRGGRMATPLSPHKTGAVRRTGGDGDGGTAGWKTAELTNASRLALTARLEKPTIASTLRAASNRDKVLALKTASPRKQKSPTGDRKDHLAQDINGKQVAQRKAAGGKKDNVSDAQQQTNESSRRKQGTSETGIQTNEAEILNRELLVGDIKLLLPSPHLAEKLEMARADVIKKTVQTTTRRFSPYEQEEEQHLDELKQYTERTYVTKRKPKKELPVPAHYEPHRYSTVFDTMDEFFTRDVQRAESFTDIKERIKRKEMELMNMFNNVNEEVSDKIESESEGD